MTIHCILTKWKLYNNAIFEKCVGHRRSLRHGSKLIYEHLRFNDEFSQANNEPLA